MKNKKNRSSSRYQKFIKTKHVFIDSDRLFYKKEDQEPSIIEEPVVQWFPVNFQRTTI